MVDDKVMVLSLLGEIYNLTMSETRNLIGFHSSGDSISPIVSQDRNYRTVNGLGPEKQNREMTIVPCTLQKGLTLEANTTYFDNIDQPQARTILQSGCFISTESTGDNENSNFALLMSYAPGQIYSGRGGVLMYRDDGEWKPVTMTIKSRFGNRKYFLDIKGVGTPEGILRRDEEARLIGGIETADLEYISLLETEKQHPLSQEGLVPFAIYYGHDSRGYGQIARAIPTTLRSSFKFNSGFDELRKLSPEKIAQGLGLELGRYLGFNPPRLASNLQTENAYLVNKGDEQFVIATDFSEIVALHEEIKPIFGLGIALEIICASVEDDSNAFGHMAEGIIKGIKELRPNLQISENDLSEIQTRDELINYLLEKYLAKEILEQRKSNNTVIDSKYVYSKLDDIEADFYKKHPSFSVPREIDRYFQEEEQLFRVASNTSGNGKNEEILRSLEYIVQAREKLASEKTNYEMTDEDIANCEALLPIPYYS